MKNLFIGIKNAFSKFGDIVIKPFSLLTGYFMGRSASSQSISLVSWSLFAILIYFLFFAKKKLNLKKIFS